MGATVEIAPPKRWLSLLKWLGTGTGILGATLVAANIGLGGWGFLVYLVSSVSWTIAGAVMREPSLVTLHLTFTAINILGLIRFWGG